MNQHRQPIVPLQVRHLEPHRQKSTQRRVPLEDQVRRLSVKIVFLQYRIETLRSQIAGLYDHKFLTNAPTLQDDTAHVQDLEGQLCSVESANINLQCTIADQEQRMIKLEGLLRAAKDKWQFSKVNWKIQRSIYLLVMHVMLQGSRQRFRMPGVRRCRLLAHHLRQ